MIVMGRWGRGAQAGRASARRWARLGRGVLAVELASSECAVAAPASGRSRGRVSGGTWPRGGNTRREAAALSIRLEMVTLGAELVGGVGRASQPEPEVVAVPAGRTGARASRGVGVAPSATVTCRSPRLFRRAELDRARLLASRETRESSAFAGLARRKRAGEESVDRGHKPLLLGRRPAFVSRFTGSLQQHSRQQREQRSTETYYVVGFSSGSVYDRTVLIKPYPPSSRESKYYGAHTL